MLSWSAVPIAQDQREIAGCWCRAGGRVGLRCSVDGRTNVEPASTPGATVHLDVSDATPGGDLHDATHRTHVEHALRELPGVRAARIVPGYDRDIDELHVVAATDKPAKQVVRDVQSLLMARFGIATDHRVISVVQMEADDTAGDPPPRVALARVTSAQHGLAVHVAVALTDGVNEHLGTAEGPASASGRLRTAARATLEAVRPLLNDELMVEIEGATVERTLGTDVALTLVHVHTKRGTRSIAGSAVARQDEIEAVARSVLDALNRELRSVAR